MLGPNGIEARYGALVERISRYPASDLAAGARMQAEVEATYRREKAEGEARLRNRAAVPTGQGGK